MADSAHVQGSIKLKGFYNLDNPDNYTYVNAGVLDQGVTQLDTSLEASVEPNFTFRASDLVSIEVFSELVVPGDDYPDYWDLFGIILEIGGVDKYYDTTLGVWVASDGSHAQSNSIPELTEEALGRAIDVPSDVKIKLVFSASSKKVLVEGIGFSLVYEELEPEEIQLPEIYGFVKGLNEDGLAGVTVKISVKCRRGMILKAYDRLFAPSIVLTTDEEGRWSTKLPRSADLEGGPFNYYFEISSSQFAALSQNSSNQKIEFTVPPTGTSINITDLITI